MRHHHIGCACKDIEKTADKLCKLFAAERGDTIYDPQQDANLCMLTMPDGTFVELVSGRVVEGYLKKRMSYYHICYEVDGLENAISSMGTNGAVVVSPPKPAVLFNGRRVAFIMTPMGLVELLEAELSSKS